MEANLEIKAYLEDKGITQAFLSRKTGIQTTKLNLALNGARRLSLEEYSLICGVLGVDTNFFLRPKLPKVERRRGE